MKKVIKFSKFFIPGVVLSSVIVLSGLFGLVTKGLNLGIDFQAGFIEKIALAPSALTLQYAGNQTVTVSQNSSEIDLVVTGIGGVDNKTFKFPYSQYPTIGDFATAVAAVPDVTVSVIAPATTPIKSVFPDSEVPPRLTKDAFAYHYKPAGAAAISTDDIRAVIAMYPDASVQAVGDPSERTFQIRVNDDGKDVNASNTIRIALAKAFVDKYGAENVAVISTDFVGSRLSNNLANQAAWLVLATLALIWIYCAIRFRWDFAIGCVLSVFHDALIMVAFVVWTRMSFNSTTIAAILTIIGYSINDTIVVFDRIRENMKLYPDMKMTDVLNLAQTEILGRTIITTTVTMFAVMSLYVFTTGDMKDFALVLLVGMTSGVYSTIYIASAFVDAVAHFRKDGGRMVEKVKAPKEVTTGEVI
jgi:preprotein translocase subunit SecF